MGTWGPGIFSDDLAADVRDDWRGAIEKGMSPAAATSKLLADYGEAISDPDDGAKFWFALAAAQAATGRLQPQIRDHALQLIDSGGDVATFASDSPKLGAQRAAALQKLATTLRGPQRAPTRIVLPKPQPSPVGVGDLVRLSGPPEGPARFFLVVELSDGWPPGTKWPVLAGLLWDQDRDPTVEEATRAPLLRDTDGLDKMRRVPLGPTVDLTIAIAPSRGPRSWDRFGTVIATGISRPDAPSRAQMKDRGFSVGSTSWETIASWASGDWYSRVAAITRTALEVPPPKRRWPWQRH